jgi:hypothetical protein
MALLIQPSVSRNRLRWVSIITDLLLHSAANGSRMHRGLPTSCLGAGEVEAFNHELTSKVAGGNIRPGEMKAIKDEFACLPISRQRKFQLRMRRDGRCTICGAPAVGTRCLQHLIMAREKLRKRLGAKRRYKSLSYRLQSKS